MIILRVNGEQISKWYELYRQEGLNHNYSNDCQCPLSQEAQRVLHSLGTPADVYTASYGLRAIPYTVLDRGYLLQPRHSEQSDMLSFMQFVDNEGTKCRKDPNYKPKYPRRRVFHMHIVPRYY